MDRGNGKDVGKTSLFRSLETQDDADNDNENLIRNNRHASGSTSVFYSYQLLGRFTASFDIIICLFMVICRFNPQEYFRII